jgi:hypothetical protein
MTSAGNPATLSIRTKCCSLNLVVHRLAVSHQLCQRVRPCPATSSQNSLARRAVAFPSIKASCPTRPACFPNRIITCADGERVGPHLPGEAIDLAFEVQKIPGQRAALLDANGAQFRERALGDALAQMDGEVQGRRARVLLLPLHRPRRGQARETKQASRQDRGRTIAFDRCSLAMRCGCLNPIETCAADCGRPCFRP